MLPTPRSVAILLALLCGIAVSHSQSPSENVFLAERVGVKTHVGVTGLPPGTALHVVSENGDTFHVTNGLLTFDIPKAKLTTDASLAARLAQNEYAAQEAAAQLSAQQMEADRQAQTAKRAGQLPQQPTAHDIYGSFVPEGGGPVMPATPENLARFGAPVYGTGANAARAVQAQVDRDLAAAGQQQAQLQRAQAARRIAANNGRHRNQTAAQQQAEQRRMAGDDEARLAKREAGKAENQIQDLKRQAGEVRERERYEYNKAATERGNQATYNVERTFDRNIQSLQGQINNNEREKAYWENRASQAEQH